MGRWRVRRLLEVLFAFHVLLSSSPSAAFPRVKNGRGLGQLGSPCAWGSVRLVSLQFLHIIAFFTVVKQLKPWGFVRYHPSPSPSPSPSLTHLHPLPPYGPPFVTFLTVKDNIKVIFIFVKALSCLGESFPKPDYCCGGRQLPRDLSIGTVAGSC